VQFYKKMIASPLIRLRQSEAGDMGIPIEIKNMHASLENQATAILYSRILMRLHCRLIKSLRRRRLHPTIL
jgi:hypothetical protein